VKIERNIPIPESSRSLGYPWPKMQIGDSILVNVAKCGSSGVRAHKSWGQWSQRNGITDRRIVSRSLGKGRVRIWMQSKEGAK